MHPTYFTSIAEEKSRYQLHNNDVNDPRYQDFVMPIVNGVLTDFTKKDLIVLILCVGFLLLNLAAIGSTGREAARSP